MPVPTRITDLSATAADNSPAGTDTVGPNLDDYLRGIQSVIRGDLATKGADIASSTTTDLGAVQGFAHDITGTTTITGFGTVAAGVWKVLKFEGALTLTHNATSLILPGGENITTADGDTAIFISEGSGNWRCLNYSPAAINPAKTVSTDESQTLTNKTLTSPVIQGTVGAGTGLTLPALVLSGNVTSTGNPSLNLGSGALTAGATSVTTLTASAAYGSNNALTITATGGTSNATVLLDSSAGNGYGSSIKYKSNTSGGVTNTWQVGTGITGGANTYEWFDGTATRMSLAIGGGLTVTGALSTTASISSFGAATSYTGTSTDFTVNQTGTIYYRQIGDVVVLDIVNFAGTSNATTFTITGMPAAIRPATTKNFIGYAQDNSGANVVCLFTINSSGVITIYKDLQANAFTASGDKALGKISVSYTLN